MSLLDFFPDEQSLWDRFSQPNEPPPQLVEPAIPAIQPYTPPTFDYQALEAQVSAAPQPATEPVPVAPPTYDYRTVDTPITKGLYGFGDRLGEAVQGAADQVGALFGIGPKPATALGNPEDLVTGGIARVAQAAADVAGGVAGLGTVVGEPLAGLAEMGLKGAVGMVPGGEVPTLETDLGLKPGETLQAIQSGDVEKLARIGQAEFNTEQARNPWTAGLEVAFDPLTYANPAQAIKPVTGLMADLQKAKAGIEAATALTDVAADVSKLSPLQRLTLSVFKPLTAEAGELLSAEKLGAPTKAASEAANRLKFWELTPFSKVSLYGQKVSDTVKTLAVHDGISFDDMAGFLKAGENAVKESRITPELQVFLDANPALNSANGQRLVRGLAGIGEDVDQLAPRYQAGQKLLSAVPTALDQRQVPALLDELKLAETLPTRDEALSKVVQPVQEVLDRYVKGGASGATADEVRQAVQVAQAKWDAVSKLELAGKVAERVAGNILLQTGITPPNVLTRLTSVLKQYESVLFLSTNPHAVVQNLASNTSRLLQFGINPYTSGEDIAALFKRVGFEPDFEFNTTVGRLMKDGNVPHLPLGMELPRWLQNIPGLKQMNAAWKDSEFKGRQLAFLKGFTTAFPQYMKRGVAFEAAANLPEFKNLEQMIRSVYGERGVAQFYARLESALTVDEARQGAQTFFKTPAWQAYSDEITAALSKRLSEIAQANGGKAITLTPENLGQFVHWRNSDEINTVLSDVFTQMGKGLDFEAAWQDATYASAMRLAKNVARQEEEAVRAAHGLIEEPGIAKAVQEMRGSDFENAVLGKAHLTPSKVIAAIQEKADQIATPAVDAPLVREWNALFHQGESELTMRMIQGRVNAMSPERLHEEALSIVQRARAAGQTWPDAMAAMFEDRAHYLIDQIHRGSTWHKQNLEYYLDRIANGDALHKLLTGRGFDFGKFTAPYKGGPKQEFSEYLTGWLERNTQVGSLPTWDEILGAARTGGNATGNLNPQAEAAWVREMLDALKPYLAQDAANLSRPLPAEVEQLALKYVDDVVGPGLLQARLGASAIGRWFIDRTVLSYLDRTNFDDALGYLAPYTYWPLHMAGNIAQDIVDRPAVALWAMRAYNAIAETSNGPDIPERLRGKLRLAVGGLPGPLRDLPNSVFVDPMQSVYPALSVAQSVIPGLKEQFTDFPTISERLREMAKAGLISETDAQNAIANRSGPLWDQAKGQVAAESAQPGGNPIANLFSLHLPIQIAQALLNGDSVESILANIPAARLVRGLTAPTVPGGIGLASKYDGYYLLRELGAMRAEGKIDDETYRRTLISHSGPAWDEARRRMGLNNYTLPVGVGTFLNGGKVLTQGEEMYGAARLQRANLVKQEIGRLGGNPDMPYDEQYPFLKSHGAYDEGQPLRVFLDSHPELDFSLRNSDQEKLYKDWLVTHLWDKVAEAPALQARVWRAELGDEFNNLFYLKKTRDYSQIPIATLEGWANALHIEMPRPSDFTPPTPAPAKVSFTTQAQDDSYDAYQNDLKARFPENAGAVSGQYGQADKETKKALLAAHPWLKDYWAANDRFYKENPDILKVLEDSGAKTRQAVQSNPSQAQVFVQAVNAAGLDYEAVQGLQDAYLSLDKAERRAWSTAHPAEFAALTRYWDLSRAFWNTLTSGTRPGNVSGNSAYTSGSKFNPAYGLDTRNPQKAYGGGKSRPASRRTNFYGLIRGGITYLPRNPAKGKGRTGRTPYRVTPTMS